MAYWLNGLLAYYQAAKRAESDAKEGISASTDIDEAAAEADGFVDGAADPDAQTEDIDVAVSANTGASIVLQPAPGQMVVHLEMKHSGEVGVRHSSRSSGKSRRSSRTPRDSHAELMRTVEDLKRKHQRLGAIV